MSLTPDQLSTLAKLLDEALDLPAPERDRWLGSLDEQYASLRPTLSELLTRHERQETDRFLDTLPKFADDADAIRQRMSADMQADAVVGEYRLVREIGRGGMSTVWLAERTAGVKRAVALKLPYVLAHRADAAGRFIRERDILSALSHPHIARLYDAGVTERGQPYLAMEYVEGTPLIAHCEARDLDARQRLRLFIQVLDAVQYAHSRLVIHRDLKPSNILVTASGQVALLDFGIAKLIVDGEANATELTQLGGRALTPSYASPEQIAGIALSTASDIYSLGVVLYELLTGAAPYKVEGTSRRELEDAVISGAIVRPESKALRGDLEMIVLKALRREPSGRYLTAQAFAEDIDRYLRQMPVLARPESRWYATRKFVARHRTLLAVGTAALACVLIAAAVAIVEARHATVERDRALNLSSRNEAVSGFLNTLITEAAQSEKPVTVSDMLKRSEKLAEIEYSGNAENRAAVLDMLGQYYYTTGDNQHAAALFVEAQRASRSSADWDLRAQITCHAAAPAQQMRTDPASLAALTGTIEDTRTGDQTAAQCLLARSNIERDTGDFAASLKDGEAALARLHRLAHPSADVESSLLAEVGTTEHLAARNDLAEQYFARSLATLEGAGLGHSANAIAIRNNWAVVSNGAGDPRRALELYEDTIKIAAADDPTAPVPDYLLGNRAGALFAVGRFDEAARAYEQCIGQTSNLAQANCLLGMASLQADTGQTPLAQDYASKAAAIIEPKASAKSGLSLALAIVRGKIALADRRYAEARQQFSSVIDRVKTTPHTVVAFTLRAEVARQEGHLQDAAADARAAIELSEKLQAGQPYSSRTGFAEATLGEVLDAEGEKAAARKALESAVAHLRRTVDAAHPQLERAERLLKEQT